MNSISERVAQELGECGYSVVREAIAELEFMKICSALGTPWRRTEICIQENAEIAALTRSAMSLHTDNPHANIMAWHCKLPCHARSPTWILDSKPILAKLSMAQLKLLNEIMMPIPSWEGSHFDPEPLVTPSENSIRLNFIPWTEKMFPSEQHRSAYGELVQLMNSHFATCAVPVALGKWQSLFIDNNRMLHGRGNLPERSERHLTRIWINVEDSAYVTRPGVCNI